MWSSIVGFLVMTGCYYRLDFAYGKLKAINLAEEVINLGPVCSNDFNHHYDDGYSVSFVNEEDNRTVTVDWKYFFFDQSVSFTIFNPPDCPQD